MHRLLTATAALAVLAMAASTARAADKFFVYNETTSSTFKELYLAPAGTTHWGANQTLNDKDKTLEPSERLPLKGVKHEAYDVKILDQAGKSCVKTGVNLAHESSFVVRDEDLQHCS